MVAGSCMRPNQRAFTVEHPAEASSARRLSGSPRSPSGSAFHGVYSVRTSSAYLPLCAELDVGHTPVVLQAHELVVRFGRSPEQVSNALVL